MKLYESETVELREINISSHTTEEVNREREKVEGNLGGKICTEGDTFSGTKDRKQ